MKKLLLLPIIFIGTLTFAQIGLGNANPRGALDINRDDATNNMGLVLPTNANVNNIINPLGGNIAAGTVVYDSTNDCVRFYKGDNTWSNCLSDETCDTGIIATLDCASAAHTGSLTSGIPANVTSTIPYTGGNGGSHNGQTVTSTGVTGLTATLPPGNFENGNGTLIYTITGTPSAAGTARFTLNIGGTSCELTRNVIAPIGTIIGLNCGGAINSGILTAGTPVSGVSSQIPYTGGSGGSHNGQTVSSTGVTGLTATLAPGNLTGNGVLTYIITGTPSSAGTASFAINIGGRTCTLTRTVELPEPVHHCIGTGHISYTYFPNFSTSSGVSGTISGPRNSLTQANAARYCLQDNSTPSARNVFNILDRNNSISYKFNKLIGGSRMQLFSPSISPNAKPTFYRNGVQVYPNVTTTKFESCNNTWTTTHDAKGVWFDEIRFTADTELAMYVCTGSVAP